MLGLPFCNVEFHRSEGERNQVLIFEMRIFILKSLLSAFSICLHTTGVSGVTCLESILHQLSVLALSFSGFVIVSVTTSPCIS